MKPLKLTLSMLALSALLLSATRSPAQTPSGFSWINMETDQTTMKAVRQALRNEQISAIREVGLKGGQALVMVTRRETDDPIPDYDQWSIYSVSLQTGKSRLLVFGYGVKLVGWIGSRNDELAITYYDCWECEPATLFTTLYLAPARGWSARWPNRQENATTPQPGAVVKYTDVGEPFGDDPVDQVFAVVSQPGNSFAAGSWFHSRDEKTGTVKDDVLRYSIDAKAGEQVRALTGQAALEWERRICTASNALIQPATGQDSAACRKVLRPAKTTK